MAAPAEPPTPAPIIPPNTLPDIAAGELIYADKCAACHGSEGLGDGELANELSFAPAPLGDPEFASAADPLEWYRTVTVGNLDRLMPGFVSLTDQQRWDVVGYALSLSAASAQEVASEVEDEQELDPEPEQSLPSGTVTGTISNGSAGASVPTNMHVTLLGYDGDQEVVTESTGLDSDGSFKFEDLEYVGRLFFSSVIHDGLTYRSEVAHVTSDGAPLDLPITIFETTNDPSAMRVERLHLIVDFPAEDVLRVLELWVLANDSDRVLTWPLQVALPEAATNLSFDDGILGGRFEITEFGFVDLEPIPPGTGIDHLAFGFDMPIDRSLDFDQRMLHPVDAVSILIPAGGARVSGLMDQGVQDMGGLRMQTFTSGSLSPEGSLSFEVTVPSASSNPSIAAIVGVGALVIAALVVGFVARPTTQIIEEENWVEAIAHLDDDYEAGALSEDEWLWERERLKRQALDQMRRSDD
jgi:mono/diheme cytochrome c family protein